MRENQLLLKIINQNMKVLTVIEEMLFFFTNFAHYLYTSHFHI